MQFHRIRRLFRRGLSRDRLALIEAYTSQPTGLTSPGIGRGLGCAHPFPTLLPSTDETDDPPFRAMGGSVGAS